MRTCGTGVGLSLMVWFWAGGLMLHGQELRNKPIAVDASAMTLFAQDLQLSAAAPGLLSDLGVSEGDVVEGQAILASLDRREMELRVELAKQRHVAAVNRRDSTVELRLAAESVTIARKNKQRMDDLIEQAVSQSERDQTNFEYQRAMLGEEQAHENRILNSIEVDVLQHEIRLAEQLLDMQLIKAPVKGLVVAVFKRPGEYVQAGEPVLRLVKNDVMRVSALVTVEEAAGIERGFPVRFLSGENRSDHSIAPVVATGRVLMVSPENLRENRSSVPIIAEIDNPAGLLKANISGTLEIYQGEAVVSSPADR